VKNTKKAMRKIAAIFLSVCLFPFGTMAAQENMFSDVGTDEFLLKAAETLSACYFFLIGKYNHVLLSAADLQSAEAEPVTGSTNIRLKCTEAGAKKLEKVSKRILQETGNKVIKGLINGQFLGEAIVEEIISNGEIVLKGGFSETQAKEAVQEINNEIRHLAD
jgi:preprotein translocase subunit SecD